MNRDELDAHLRLALASGLGPRLTHRLVAHFGGAAAAVGATTRELGEVAGIGASRASAIRRALDEAAVDEQWRCIEQHGVTLLPIDDPGYPALLKHIHDPPPLLYVRGMLNRNDGLAVAIVGSRRCTAYGREQAERLGAGCAQAGLAVVSGGARGIDSAAHRAAMRVKGRTIAVLGCGLSQCYPPENAELFDQIASSGAVISELPMTSPPVAEHFPRRNRIISGLALGVLVVEAARRSGALITARLAAEEHHREVMALPGRADSGASSGCHHIIREGWATLVTNAADVLECMGEAGRMLRESVAFGAGPDDVAAGSCEPSGRSVVEATLTEPQRRLVEALAGEASDIDALSRATGLEMATLRTQLTLLELRGVVERIAGNRVRLHR
jgi:DNA processing protein